jgi:hypothetical protein
MKASASVVGTVLALGFAADGASAAFVEPPPLPHDITAFPDRDFVAIDGYEPSTAYTIRILRNGVTIGSAQGTTDSTGLLEANHPGGVCWSGATPNISAQDKVVVTPVGDASDTGDAMTVADVSAQQAVIEGTNVVVRGTAKNADGTPRDLGSTEQRIVNPAFRDIGLPKRDIRAILGGDAAPNGELVADVVNTDGAWTATYTTLNAAQRQAAVDGQTRMLAWQETNAAGDRLGITIHEVGEVGGPGFGGCPGAQDWAVTATDHPAITKSMADAGDSLTVSGVARDSTSVSVTLGDGATSVTMPATTLSPAPGAQTWTATFSAADLALLPEGTLTASAAYTVPDTENVDPTATVTFSGVNKTIVKDTFAPGDPDATPGPGTYASAQAVTLDGPDPAANVHFTVNGSNPTATSHLAPAQINVTSSLTIRAIAVDAVGNTSAIKDFAYTIAPPPVVVNTPAGGGATPTGSGTAASGGGATGAGDTVTDALRPQLALQALGTSPRVAQTRAQTAGLRFVMRLPAGTGVVQIKILRKSAKGSKVLSNGFKAPSAAGLYRVTQAHLQLRRQLKRGSYVVEATPGYSKTELGKTSKYAFKVI